MEDEIKTKLKTLVNEKRYNHSLLVAEEAMKLAKVYNVDENKAYLTGLCHDIAKDFSIEENKKWIEKYKLDNSLLNDDYKKLIHADVGALVVKEWYSFDDEMCNAIKYHTIGNSTMTTLEKIVFIADKIGRDELSTDLLKVKDLAYKNLDESLLLFFKEQKKYLNSTGKDLHPITKQLIKNLEQI